MTTQITVRIDDDLVAFADGQVRAGHVRSRAALIERTLRRERRRLAAQRDAQIYAGLDPDDDDLAGFTEAATVNLDLSDLD